ncbi:hypothetical protein J3458_001710 [Metarhizium acridum]|uniref:uncharacterized protein n=1 Tax=Metarhizium acridum TaxID=92637 RepID=UPI001C6A90DD|nr:hypothetical protein J3458_001710 [Metarhizium acridum]
MGQSVAVSRKMRRNLTAVHAICLFEIFLSFRGENYATGPKLPAHQPTWITQLFEIQRRTGFNNAQICSAGPKKKKKKKKKGPPCRQLPTFTTIIIRFHFAIITFITITIVTRTSCIGDLVNGRHVVSENGAHYVPLETFTTCPVRPASTPLNMSNNIVAESWTWYALVWFVVLCRIVSQILLRGSIKKLRPDDGLILFAMMTYTVLIVSINIVSDTASNLIDPNDHVVLTPESVRERRFGSKMVLIVEQMQISTVWIVKTCLLIMYYRLTLGLAQNTAVKLVAVYVAIGWIVMEMLYFGVWCRPFSGYWEVPPSNPQCATALHHLITNAVFNISSDIMIILIPIPLLLRTQWPLKKKLILCVVFGLGGFTVSCASHHL